MSFWVTSDTHFGHRNIMKDTFCAPSRPHASVEEMDEFIIETWNKHITAKDTVYHLGDFSMTHDFDADKKIFDRLNGHKNLLLGNHDGQHTKRLGWDHIAELREIHIPNNKVIMFHYPMEQWNKSHRGTLHLHGHVHSMKNVPKTADIPNRIDVGWDRHMRPLHMDEIVKHFETPFL